MSVRADWWGLPTSMLRLRLWRRWEDHQRARLLLGRHSEAQVQIENMLRYRDSFDVSLTLRGRSALSAPEAIDLILGG